MMREIVADDDDPIFLKVKAMPSLRELMMEKVMGIESNRFVFVKLITLLVSIKRCDYEMRTSLCRIQFRCVAHELKVRYNP